MNCDVGMSLLAKEVSAALLALCSGLLTPAFIAWTTLSTWDEFPATNVSYKFVTRLITCQNPQVARIHASQMLCFRFVASPLSRNKAYTSKSRSCMHTNFVCSVRMDPRQCTRKRHGTRRYQSIIQNFRNVGKLSTCANSGYQALFSNFSNGHGYEATSCKMTM